MNLIKHLRSNNFAIIIAILSVLVQSFHSFTAFYNTSSLNNGWGIAQAVLFAVIIDLAILFYTVRGRRDISMYAAVAMVTINAYYYYQHLGVTFEFIFGCFLSLIIPISVYFYSEEIKDNDDNTPELSITKRSLSIANQVIEELKTERNHLKGEVNGYEAALSNNKDAKNLEEESAQWKQRYELLAANNTALKNDLDYVRKQMNNDNGVNANHAIVDEFVPDPLEEKNIVDEGKTLNGPPITITRTGGQKL